LKSLVFFLLTTAFFFVGIVLLFYREGCLTKELTEEENTIIQEIEEHDDGTKLLKERRKKLQMLKEENRNTSISASNAFKHFFSNYQDLEQQIREISQDGQGQFRAVNRDSTVDGSPMVGGQYTTQGGASMQTDAGLNY